MAMGKVAPHPEARKHVSEADLVLPDLNNSTFLGLPGKTLLYSGLLVCAAGLYFGIMVYKELKAMPAESAGTSAAPSAPVTPTAPAPAGAKTTPSA